MSYGLYDGIAHYVPLIKDGWSSVEKCQYLAGLIIETAAMTSVEIGVYSGKGTLAMAMAHRHQNIGAVHGIDPWSVDASLEAMDNEANKAFWGKVELYQRIYDGFVTMIESHHIWPWVKVHRLKSTDAIKLFDDASVSVMHQDGNHSEEVSSWEVENWDAKIKPGGYWIIDDTDWAGTAKAQRLLLERGYVLTYEGRDKGADTPPNWKAFRKPNPPPPCCTTPTTAPPIPASPPSKPPSPSEKASP